MDLSFSQSSSGEPQISCQELTHGTPLLNTDLERSRAALLLLYFLSFLQLWIPCFVFLFLSQFQPLGSARLRIIRGPERETPYGCRECSGVRRGRLKRRPLTASDSKSERKSHRDVKPAAVAVLCEHVVLLCLTMSHLHSAVVWDCTATFRANMPTSISLQCG